MEFRIEEVSSEDLIEKEELIQGHLTKKFKKGKVKKVLLINPPDVDSNIFDYSIAKRGRANNYPAYGLGVLAKHLQLNDIEVSICNLNHEVLKIVAECTNESSFDYDQTWQSILDNKIEKFKPDLIAITCLFSVTHASFVQVCKYCKDSKRSWHSNGEIPLAIGGVHITHDIQSMLINIPEADYIFLNEAEIAFVNFLKNVNGDLDIESLGQVLFRFPDYAIHFSKKLQPINEHLDVIPAYELMDIQNHAKMGTLGSWYGFLEKGTNVATVQSNRGCRAACTFCNVRIFHGVGVRQRSVMSVLDELSLLHEKYGINHIIWLDDDLLKNEERAISLFNGIVKRNLNITWDATNGLIARSLLKEEVVIAAAESGCIGINIGIESGNPKILHQIKKPGKVDTFLKAAEILQKYPKINVRALLIIGFPNETLGMMFDTIRLSEQMNLDWYNLAILQPWKNTPIYDAMVDEGLLGEEEGTLKTEASDNKVAPYQLGTYSRQRAIEKGLIQQSHFGEKEGTNQGFLQRLEISNFDEVPGAEILDDIWFYMNIRLNFSRLFRETRPIKIDQQLRFLNHVSNKTAPDNALIMYFLALIQKKAKGKVDDSIKARLDDRLKNSNYWRERFNSFGLSATQVKEESFPNKIYHGGTPKNFNDSDTSIFNFPTEEIRPII